MTRFDGAQFVTDLFGAALAAAFATFTLGWFPHLFLGISMWVIASSFFGLFSLAALKNSTLPVENPHPTESPYGKPTEPLESFNAAHNDIGVFEDSYYPINNVLEAESLAQRFAREQLLAQALNSSEDQWNAHTQNIEPDWSAQTVDIAHDNSLAIETTSGLETTLGLETTSISDPF